MNNIDKLVYNRQKPTKSL